MSIQQRLAAFGDVGVMDGNAVDLVERDVLRGRVKRIAIEVDSRDTVAAKPSSSNGQHPGTRSDVENPGARTKVPLQQEQAEPGRFVMPRPESHRWLHGHHDAVISLGGKLSGLLGRPGRGHDDATDADGAERGLTPFSPPFIRHRQGSEAGVGEPCTDERGGRVPGMSVVEEHAHAARHGFNGRR